jgi:PKD repeat protein
MKKFEKIRSVRKIKTSILLFLVVMLATVGFASAVPVANFTANPTSGQIVTSTGLPVQFTDDSTGGPFINWTWNFGDGSPLDHSIYPSHSYLMAGTFPVNLIVWNVTDYSSVSHNVTIVPLAQFTPFNSSGNVPFTIQFNDASYGQPNIWSWSFGDGNTSTLQNPSNIYTHSGIYLVNLSISRNLQTNMSGNGTITVNPIADFTINPSPGFVTDVNFSYTVFQFNGTAIGTPVVNYTWNFGDGASDIQFVTGNQSNTTHQYHVANTYYPNLTVYGSGGTVSGTVNQTLQVYPVADFTAPLNSVAGRLVHFTDNSTGDINNTLSGPRSWAWTFGDGSTASTRNPTHIYQPGKYTVTLTVTKNGLSNTTSKMISCDSPNLYLLRSGINGNTYYFMADKYGIAPGNCINFTAYPTRLLINHNPLIKNSQSIGTMYKWDFYGANDPVNDHIDYPITASQTVSVPFRDSDIYTVVLNVTDSRDTYTVTKPRLVVVRGSAGGGI